MFLLFLFIVYSLEREERALKEKKRLLLERMKKTNSPFTMTSSATGEGHPAVPSTQHSTATTNPRLSSGVGRSAGVSHSEVERERMERRVREAILNQPLHTSASVDTTATTAPPSFHSSSYHWETADQLRNRSKQPSNWDVRQFNPSGVYSMSASRTMPVQPYLPSSTPPPPPTLPPTLPNIPSSHQPILQQSISQEWTDYTSAPIGATQTVPNNSTASVSSFVLESSSLTQGLSQDVSEFDPIHS